MSTPISASRAEISPPGATHAPHTSMLLRMLVRAAILRRGARPPLCLPWWWQRRSQPPCSTSMSMCRRSCAVSFAIMARTSSSSEKTLASLPSDALAQRGFCSGRTRYGSPVRLGGRTNCRWSAGCSGRHRFRPRAAIGSVVVGYKWPAAAAAGSDWCPRPADWSHRRIRRSI